VRYGGEHGPDLQRVADHAGLSTTDVIARHAVAEYTVAMLGFAPGFPYLLGLDAALATPRLATPRTRVPAGSVAIGGAQTGLYPQASPGGWNLIGRTDRVLFDPQRDPPALLAPGDRVRFVPVADA
jgi:KipI family sensor histidine kinase inhibitor